MAQKQRSVNETASKILNGERLTREEFEVAKGAGYYNQKLDFETLDSTFYDSPTRKGWLCLNPKTGKIRSERTKSKKNPDGTRSFSVCLFGIHREDIKPEFLRPEQKRYW
jgi:hypothetical protein